MHSHFWDGEDGGGGEPAASTPPFGYVSYQIVIIRASLGLALLLVG
jgi:hypothetical protein